MYHVWNQWFHDITMETLRKLASSTSSDTSRTGSVNRTARRSSPSIIPSLFELASSSFKILKVFNSKVRPSVTEDIEDGTLSPLSTPSEVRFCDSVIAESDGPEGEVQRRCALNYKRWILLWTTPPLECNGAIRDEGTATTAS